MKIKKNNDNGKSNAKNFQCLKNELKTANYNTGLICSALITNYPEKIVIIDHIGTIKYINNNSTIMYNTVGKKIYDFQDNKAQEEYRQIIKDVFEKGSIRTEIISVLCPDNKKLWFNTTFIPIKENKKIVLIMMIPKDITEQRDAEDALKESEEQFRLISEQSVMGIAIIQDNIFKYLNKTFANIFEYPVKEMLAWEKNSISNLIHTEDTEIAVKQINKEQNNKKQDVFINFKWRGITKQGKEKWIESFSRSIIFKGKSAVLISLIDITQRQLLEEQLLQSHKMKAIGQLAGGIAHDFNNMLAGIMGFAELLAYKIEDVKLKTYADNIVKASIRASELTRQLLAFARKEHKQSKPININKIITNLIKFLKHSIDKSIRIEKSLKADPPITLGDSAQLQNALLNLSINARDAMPNGGDLIFATEILEIEENEIHKVYAERIEPGKYLQISVTDSGIGIDPETKKHIFEPFFSTKTHHDGAGMGLAAVYGIIRSHYGFISVDSELGKGSVFKILLQLNEASIKKEAPNIRIKLSAPRILIIDDEEIILEMLSEMLINFGHEIKVFNNGINAVEYYKKEWKNIDLVILDMEMPHMNGRDVYFEMQKINPSVKVLISSGNSMEEDTRTLLNNGVMGFLQKPYKKDNLVEIINEIKNMDN